MHPAAVFTLALALSANASPTGMRRVNRRAPSAVDIQNGKDAIALNKQFAGIAPGAACTAGQNACAGDKFAQCVGNAYVAQPCAATLVCAALPNIGSAGTSVTCTTPADRDARILASGASATGSPAAAPPAKSSTAATPPAAAPPAQSSTAASPPTAAPAAGDNAATAGSTGDLQSSLTLDPSVIQKGFLNDGQQPPVDGQVPSLTSGNNFINFCAKTLPNTPLTNGVQVTTGSCNGAPIGLIPASSKMPSSKFVNPPNGATIPANTNFTIELNLKNVDAGHFTNAQQNYYAAPQQLNSDGIIIGHTHCVIEKLPSLDTTVALDPTTFVFFKGINTPLKDGIVSTPVDKGVPAGFYRLCSQNAAMNHQPVIVPIAQHGNLDDCIYFKAQ